MSCSRGCCPTQRDHYRSLAISARVAPSSNAELVETLERGDRWNRDHDAYRRLRKDGVQPRKIDGSAHLEKHASQRSEIETGMIAGDKGAANALDAMVTS